MYIYKKVRLYTVLNQLGNRNIIIFNKKFYHFTAVGKVVSTGKNVKDYKVSKIK